MCSAAVDFFSIIYAAIAHQLSAVLVDELRASDFQDLVRIRTSADTLGRNPERSRCNEGIDGTFLPPCDFVSVAMDVAVMNSA